MQVPLRVDETGESEDPKYHDNLEGIQIRQAPLMMTRTAMKRVTLLSRSTSSKRPRSTTVDPQNPVDVKFRVVDPEPLRNVYDYFRGRRPVYNYRRRRPSSERLPTSCI